MNRLNSLSLFDIIDHVINSRGYSDQGGVEVKEGSPILFVHMTFLVLDQSHAKSASINNVIPEPLECRGCDLNARTTKDRILSPTPLAKLSYPCMAMPPTYPRHS